MKELLLVVLLLWLELQGCGPTWRGVIRKLGRRATEETRPVARFELDRWQRLQFNCQANCVKGR
jgi:hypothetical protein